MSENEIRQEIERLENYIRHCQSQIELYKMNEKSHVRKHGRRPAWDETTFDNITQYEGQIGNDEAAIERLKWELMEMKKGPEGR